MFLKYKEYKKMAKTGDLIFFSGTGPIAKLLQFAMKNKWNHVGIIINPLELSDFHKNTLHLNEEELYVFESTSINKVKDISGDFVKGVQITRFQSRIDAHRGSIGVRQIDSLHMNQIDTLIHTCDNLRFKPYEKNLFDLLGSWIDGTFGWESRKNLTSIFCTELIGFCLVKMKIFSDSFNYSDLTPEELTKEALPLIFGHSYQEMEELVNN
jgi:hypothetical protein